MADERATGALEFIQEQINKLLADVADKKKMANAFAVAAGLDAPYIDIEEVGALAQSGVIRPDQFANHSAPSTAARAYLESRGKTRGAATVEVIYDALVQGGYNFGSTASEAKNGLRIALGKDLQVHRLPNGHYGLMAWYPNVTRAKTETKPKKAGDPEPDDESQLSLTDGQQEASPGEKAS